MIEKLTYLIFLYVYPLILTLVSYVLLLHISPQLENKLSIFIILFTVYYIAGTIALEHCQAHHQPHYSGTLIILIVIILSIAGYELVKRLLTPVRTVYDTLIIAAASALVASLVIKIRGYSCMSHRDILRDTHTKVKL